MGASQQALLMASAAAAGGPSSSLTWGSIANGAWTKSGGDLIATSSQANGYIFSAVSKSSGKWFTVVRVYTMSLPSDGGTFGFGKTVAYPPGGYLLWNNTGGVQFASGWSGSAMSSAFATAGVDIHIALNCDTGKGWLGVGALPGDPVADTGNNFTGTASDVVYITAGRNNNYSGDFAFEVLATLPASPPSGFSVWE